MSKFLATDLADTICALATPQGVGAIGVIRVSGQQSIAIINAIFSGKDLNQAATHTIHFGKIIDDGNILDEVLVSVFKAPKSYTGENSVEISTHGSPYILQKTIELLVNHGARLAKPGEFTLRAFLNKKLDLSQAEAVADLIASESTEGHKMAMQQMRGGFSAEINAMREKLINFASLIELELDFAEEDVEFAKREELVALVASIQNMLQALIQSFKLGNAIKNGIPTVIAGKPNAGKSTLLNALVNEERAIVSPIAGTTRDSIEETFVIDGILFRLVDTAGIREHTSDAIEAIGIERTFKKINEAGIVVYLFDATTTTNESLAEELGQFVSTQAHVIAVGNKTDLLDIEKPFGADVIKLSAKSKQGISTLKQKLVSVVKTEALANNMVISNVRHYQALTQANEALQLVMNAIDMQLTGELLAFDIRKALFHLGEITGEVTTDDLLANIFSKFCIGK